METRRLQLLELKGYTDSVEKEFTMMLQSLQWDRNSLLQKPALVSCKYDSNHKIPSASAAEHEKRCYISHHGYSKDELLLPDPLYQDSSTIVKLSKEDITNILQNASSMDASFNRGMGSSGPEPLSLERLQRTYTADERRAIHDAVVSAVPFCHDLADLALTSAEQGKEKTKVLSRAEILAELRNMRRRRTKYRVAAKSRNYSDVLRDVIKTQMEHYSEAKTGPEVQQTQDVNINDKQTDAIPHRYSNKDNKSDQYNNDERRKEMRRDGTRETNEIYNKYKEQSRNVSNREYENQFRDRYEKHRDRSKELRNNDKESKHSNNDHTSRYDSYKDREVKMKREDNNYKRQHRETNDSDTRREDSRITKYKNYDHHHKKSSEIRIKQEKDKYGEDRDLRYYNERSDKYKRSKESKYERADMHSKRKDKDRRGSKEKRNKEYDNVRVKTERSSKERSYDSYTAQGTSYGDDKYRRYYDLQSHESRKRK